MSSIAAANSPARAADTAIVVRGCRVHNLRNVDVDVPRDQLVVITGPSGSGKSSLAFDTIYAEGQRQYIDSLSVYARQFLSQLERPDVDLVEGLQPTISIDQRAGSTNPRSTVATVTEIYDYLRLLYARVGEPHCYQCGTTIQQRLPDQILDDLLSLPTGTKIVLMAPLVRGRKGRHEEVFASIRKAGFVRVRVDGLLCELDAAPTLVPQKNHTIEAVVDRLVVRDGVRPRFAESLQVALRHGEGIVTTLSLGPSDPPDAWHERLFNTEFTCPNCQLSYEEIEPRTFSFNSPYGACSDCDGLGIRSDFDRDRIAPDLSRSIANGALLPWVSRKPRAGKRPTGKVAPRLAALAEAIGCGLDTPLDQLRPRQLEQLWTGVEDVPGVLALLAEAESAATNDVDRAHVASFRGTIVCPACGGARLRPEARSVRIGSLAIHELTSLAVDAARTFTANLQFTGDAATIAEPLLREIRSRVDFLHNVGLDYITLDRPADTLSGGELQRIRLATGLGSALVGVCYVLDEPSIGLHPRDNDRLIRALRDLQQQGNTVLVVEHDEAIMRTADWLIDVGPGAGHAGGLIVATGTPAEVMSQPASITGQYLSGQMSIAVPKERRKPQPTRRLQLVGARGNNLQNVTVDFPLGILVCVTGVSGSGKSTLVNDTLAAAIAHDLNGAATKPAPFDALHGIELIERFVAVDQAPIGRSPRSNPATYTGLFDEIRQVFAQTREARLRGYKANRFSFNVAGGRCEACEGQGQQKIEMNFLPDLYVPCAVCQGARFNPATLDVRYRERSIADCLAMPVDEARDFFANFPAIRRLLDSLHEVGLGYLTLGQPSTTLSGGEAQRIKLATELARGGSGHTLYVLDEPTTGLHFDDVRRLLTVLDRLVGQGNSVLVIEHHLDVIQHADWLIDLGPEGGAGGGQIIFTGPPETLAQQLDNATGRFLSKLR